MRKILPIFIALVVFVGAAYALVPALFPDTALFPRIPSGSGSIGWVISRLIGSDIETYTGTWVIENTLMLDGTTASGYLTANNCVWTDKWVGIDANNKPICGSTSTFLGDFWKIESQDCSTSTIYHASGSLTNPTSTGHTLKSWDILKTSPGCTMTIAFSDLSILRLDGDTVVSFDIGYLSGGTSIASALLENGSLWWRILTETGSYSVGTHEIIAWVRGTSISLISTGNTIWPIAWSGTGWTIPRTPSIYPVEVAIIDTTTSTGAVIACRKTDGWYRPLSNLERTKSYIVPPGWCGDTTPSIIARPKDAIFMSSPWAKRNTVKDLDYMYRKLALSWGTLTLTKNTILDNEIATTIPENTGGVLTLTGILEASNLCSSGEVYWNKRYWCQNSQIRAIADYTLPDPDSPCAVRSLGISVYSFGSIFHVCPTSQLWTELPWAGYQIGNAQYIVYSWWYLRTKLGSPYLGKKIKFELNDSPNVSAAEKRVLQFNGAKYIWFKSTSDKFNYDWGIYYNFWTSIWWWTINGGGKSWMYIFSAEPDYFIVGNDSWFLRWLNQKIKRIEIWNP